MSNDFDYKWGSDSGNVGILATEIGSLDMSSGAIGATVDISNYSFNWNSPAYTISAGSTGQSYYSSTYAANTSVNIDTNGIDIKNGADIKIGERSLSEFMDRVESRLAILQPKPELLEKFEALKQAYEQYKLLEALCMGDIPRAPDHA